MRKNERKRKRAGGIKRVKGRERGRDGGRERERTV